MPCPGIGTDDCCGSCGCLSAVVACCCTKAPSLSIRTVSAQRALPRSPGSLALHLRLLITSHIHTIQVNKGISVTSKSLIGTEWLIQDMCSDILTGTANRPVAYGDNGDHDIHADVIACLGVSHFPIHEAAHCACTSGPGLCCRQVCECPMASGCELPPHICICICIFTWHRAWEAPVKPDVPVWPVDP